MNITIYGRNREEERTEQQIQDSIAEKANKFSRNVITGFCDEISFDLIENYLACMNAGGIPVFLSHPSPKSPASVFQSRLNNWKKLGIKNYISSFVKDEDSEKINNPYNISFIQLSSGTTSSQKGFGFSLKKLKEQIREYCKVCNITKDSVIVSWLPIYHDMGLITSIFIPYFIGCKVVIIPTFEWLGSYGLLIDAINKHGGTHCWMPNFAFDVMCNINCDDLLRDCMFINCSEMCREQTISRFLKKFPKAKVEICYALAENVFAVSQGSYEKSDSKHLSCGKVLSNTKVDVVDSEIFISGDCLFDATLQAGRFLEPPTQYNTGDLGCINNLGELIITGRKKEVAKVYGKQIYLPDVDFEINQQASVKKGRVVSFSLTESSSEKIVVMYESDQNNDLEIKKIVKDYLDVICTTIRVPNDTLIKTSSGKLSREENLKYYNQILIFFELLKNYGYSGSPDCFLNLKSDGILDSFSIMEFLTILSSKTKLSIDWNFDFSKLDDFKSFWRALK